MRSLARLEWALGTPLGASKVLRVKKAFHPGVLWSLRGSPQRPETRFWFILGQFWVDFDRFWTIFLRGKSSNVGVGEG